MSDPEIIALRKVLAQRVRSDDVAQRRRDIDARGRAYKLPADVTVEPVTAHGVRSEWTATPDADRGKAVLYLHGGGYVIGSLDSHRHVIAEMGRAARSRALAIDYRLAPEHPFPAAVDDALAGYRFLLANGVPASGVTVAGDSAGGGLVIAAMLAIRDAGLPQPACGWAVSPWVDMEAIGGSMVSKAATDPTVQRAGILDMARQYLNGADLTFAARRADLWRSARTGAAADTGGGRRGFARRFDSTRPDRRRRRCRGRSANLAGDNSRLAPLPSRACSRTTRHRRRR